MEIGGETRKHSFRIGGFIIKPDRNLLVKDGVSYSLEPRIMDVLCVIAAQPREVISRDRLIARVWNVEYGADESLTRAISILRKTFRSAGETEEFIQTIPKRGYRWAKNVSISRAPPAPLEPNLITPGNTDISPEYQAARHVKHKGVILGVLALLFLGGLIIIMIILPRYDTKIGRSLGISEYGRSVAVLSLVDMSAGGNQEHFSDGMAEAILNQLTQIPNLRMVGRTSSFAFKGKSVDIREIGNTLKVSHIIDGSVRKHNDRLRVTIQLINTVDGVQIWSKTYDGYSDDIFNLQENISRDVADELIIMLGINIEHIADIEL